MTGVELLDSDVSEGEIKARAATGTLMKGRASKSHPNFAPIYYEKHVAWGSKIHALGQGVPHSGNNKLPDPKSILKASPAQLELLLMTSGVISELSH